jgi:microsomal dipeptidase-like Zn-dependent dipeptidase
MKAIIAERYLSKVTVLILYVAIATTAAAQVSKLHGFVDLHTHPLANLGFGGKLFYGGVDVGSLLPADPNCNHDVRAGSMQQALGHDNSTHGGWGAFDNKCGDDIRKQIIHQIQQGTPGAADESDNAQGAPGFGEWPVWNDITHQKMWVDWIRRAYDGGLRVMVALAVNNKTLGDMTAGPGDFPTDDKWSADKQIGETKDFVGRHSDFMQVAYSSADVERIVSSNKLAVVLGVEIDNIGDFNTVHPLTNSEISAEINRLYKEGVRYIFPVHIIDNPFGGTAAYEDLFNYSNYREAGHWWNLVCATPQDDITYHFHSQNSFMLSAAILAKFGNLDMAFRNPPNYPNCGQRNNAALTTQGEFALKEMMRHGMLIDLDHMSQNTFNMALGVAEKVPGGYPVNSGHSALRENGGTERNVTAQQYARIGKLHGMAGVGSAGTDACNWTNMAWKVLTAMGSGGGAIGFGTDTDGLAMGMPTSTSQDKPAAGNPAVMMGNNQQHLFYRDINNSIVHRVWDSGENRLRAGEEWGGPGSPHNAPAAAGDPAVMMGNNQQHLFYRDTQGQIVHVLWDSGQNQLRAPEIWGGLGNPQHAPPAAGDPAVMMGNNQQHLFYRDTQGQIIHVVWDAGNNQTRIEKWGGPGSPRNAPPAAGDPAVMMGNNQQHLFYRATNGSIVQIVWDSGQNQLRAPEEWAGPGSSTGAPVEAGTSAVMMGNNQQHLFYRSQSGAIWHVLWDGNTGMHSETWAPARDAASAAADGKVCSEYHPPIAYNNSFRRSGLGNHTWDYNTDGVAHYGMLADFMQAVATMPQHGNLPAGKGLVDDHLMNGAEYFFETWKIAEQQSTKVK